MNSTKKCTETHYVELVFLPLVGSMVHVVHSSASRVGNVGALFFILGWAWYGFHKKRTATIYVELVFLHPLASVGHLVHSGASEARNVDSLFSCSGGPGVVSIKSTPGHVTWNFCFYIRWDLRVT
jgi:hypothetical protein